MNGTLTKGVFLMSAGSALGIGTLAVMASQSFSHAYSLDQAEDQHALQRSIIATLVTKLNTRRSSLTGSNTVEAYLLEKQNLLIVNAMLYEDLAQLQDIIALDGGFFGNLIAGWSIDEGGFLSWSSHRMSAYGNTIAQVYARDHFVQILGTKVALPVGHTLPQAIIEHPTSNVAIAVGQKITLRGSASDGDGRIVTTHWNTQGRPPLSGSQVEVSFAAEGTYVVTFQATDNDQNNDPTPPSLTITVSNDVIPIIRPTFDDITTPWDGRDHFELTYRRFGDLTGSVSILVTIDNPMAPGTWDQVYTWPDGVGGPITHTYDTASFPIADGPFQAEISAAVTAGIAQVMENSIRYIGLGERPSEPV